MQFPWTLRMILILTSFSLVTLLYLTIHLWKGFNQIRNPSVRLLLKTLWAVYSGLSITYPAWGLLSFFTTQSFDYTAYPSVLIYLFWFGLIFHVTMLTWLLIGDIGWSVWSYFSKTKQRFRLFWKRIYLFIVVIIQIIVVGYGLYKDSNRIEVDQIRYSISDIPVNKDASPNFKIAHITDIQADIYTRKEKMERYINRVMKLEPDLILFTGDLVTTGTTYFEEGAEVMSKLSAPYGVYAVIGDHDYWANPQMYKQLLRERFIPVFDDSVTTISSPIGPIGLTGITEVYSKKISTQKLDSLLNSPANDTTDTQILFSHQATERIIEQAEPAGTDLILGGHTHGGQVHIPFFFNHWSSGDLESKFVQGVYQINELLININNGLGFTLGPVRYGAPANISLIKIFP